MQARPLPRYVGVVLLLLTLGYFLGGSHVLSASSHTTSRLLQPVAAPLPTPATNHSKMGKESGKATPDRVSDLLLTGVGVVIIVLLSLNFFLSQRRRSAKLQDIDPPETDPIIAQVSIPKKTTQPTSFLNEEPLFQNLPIREEIPIQSSPIVELLVQSASAQESSPRVTRLKNRLKTIG